ncbi:aminotransferase class I/II-fold pyridoxal phosphate-dependent enzyme [Novosphingobium umbonatum]|uniref:Aminotransferase class I/II-fold pyridoxal phosphate-dependent enzyme n=2 Tax=Novosphingobium umbonatum TaxID=1908524 RepID=A0A437N7T3_9SPHN|nr:aminotransferase class I/II-fold pyridoxal phosphate-dependent enzyme [Novosphingobium umbonatum]RVU05951.1 aminotransferase class I/II-fold pyridoxal phosphate-dependent enzyme [Novosphingobium umbonatum]
MADFTHHGGGLAQAVVDYGGHASDWLDLSTGINPVPWPVERSGVEAIDWHRLPEAGAVAELEIAAARHFGVEPRHCCAVPGSELGMRLLGRLLGGRAAYGWPAYRSHGDVFADAVAWLDLTPTLPQGCANLLLANPNNPDGRMLPVEALQVWQEQCSQRRGWLVVDEAFADACPEISMAAQVGDTARLIVLRSFGKFFGWAGLRLGFVLGPSVVLDELRALLGDWPLGAAALAYGAAAYRDSDWTAQARRDLARRARRMDELLACHGWKTLGHCPHFRLIEDAAAPRIFTTLARHHILPRPFDYRPDWLRLGIPAGEADWARLEQALGDV